MADKQFFEFKLESDTTTESWTLPFINELFLDIVNYDEVNPYYYSSWYKENLDHVYGEKAQRAKFWLKKMLPYQKIKLWRWNMWVTPYVLVEDTGTYEITDAKFLDGERYIMALYDTEDPVSTHHTSPAYNYRTRMKIFKQINITDFASCANNNYEDWSSGNFVDISRYTYENPSGTVITLDYYPRSECLDYKFTVASRGKWPIKQDGNSWYMKVELIWNDLFYYFYDTNEIINAATGDYLYINEWWLSWQIVPIAWSTTTEWHQWIETTFAWTWVNLKENEDFGISSAHWWVIYEWYWDILHFACSDGIIHINSTGRYPTDTQFTRCWAMKANTNNNTSVPSFVISSMINFRPLDNIALFDVSDGEVKYWLQWFLKFYFKASNSYFISRDYTDIHEFQDYILLLWPNKTWLSYPYIDPNSPWVMRNYYREIGDGYINRASWVDDNHSFFLASTSWLWTLELNATYANEARFMIVPKRSFQWWPFLTDITHYKRELWDVIWMSMEEKQFKLFITTEEWTVIWTKSIEHNYRRQHIIPNYVSGWTTYPRKIQKFAAGIYIGNGVYDRWWDEPIKTLLTFAFGDKTMLIPKTIHSLKLALGRDSFITKGNTVLQMSFVLSWRTYTMNFSDFNTAMRVAEMMNLKVSWNESQIYRQYANEIDISSWEWHGKFVPKRQYNLHKIKAFSDYDPQRETISDFDDQRTLANRTTTHMDIGYMCDMVTFKIITYPSDTLEFYGAQIWYDLTNEVGWSLDNSITVNDRLDDGSHPIVPK